MKILKIADDQNYDLQWNRYSREAVRAVILRGNQIALVKSNTEGFYKFPGGGIEAGESHAITLIRETMEETGLQIIPESITEFGLYQELRKGLSGEEIFDQTSYYYFADVQSSVSTQCLDEYERLLGYQLEWTDLQKAYDTNRSLKQQTFIQREAFILGLLLERTL